MAKVNYQGFFDDSGSSKHEPFYVLAGFISTVDKWKAFEEAWRAKLAEFPRLKYFKMSEASALRGQFSSGWSPSTRDQRVFELAEIIKAHATALVTSRLRRSDFDYFCSGIAPGPEMNDPYFLCFYQLVFAVHSFQMEHNNAECELIFDKQGELGDLAVSWWEGAKTARVSEDRLRFFDTCSRPVFRDDLKWVELQAADMLAWLVRECQPAGSDSLNILAQATIKQFRDLETIDRVWSKDDLLYMGATAMVKRAKEIGFL